MSSAMINVDMLERYAQELWKKFEVSSKPCLYGRELSVMTAIGEVKISQAEMGAWIVYLSWTLQRFQANSEEGAIRAAVRSYAHALKQALDEARPFLVGFGRFSMSKADLTNYIDWLPMPWVEEESPEVGASPVHRSYLAELPLMTLVVHNYNSEEGDEWILFSDGDSLGFYPSSVEAMASGDAIYKRRLKMSLGLEAGEKGGER